MTVALLEEILTVDLEVDDYINMVLMITTYDHDRNNDVGETDYVEVKMCNAVQAITFLHR